MSFVTSESRIYQFHTYPSVSSLLGLAILCLVSLPSGSSCAPCWTPVAWLGFHGPSPGICLQLTSFLLVTLCPGCSDQSLCPGDCFCVWKFCFVTLSPSWPSRAPRRHSKHCCLFTVQVVWADVRRLSTQGHRSHLQALIYDTSTAGTASGCSLHSWSCFF